MPEESINIFITNIYSIAIFIAVVFFIFVILFLLSRFFIYNRKSSEPVHKPEYAEQVPKHLPAGKYSGFHLNKDIYLTKNLYVFGILFILVIFFILLLLLVLNFSVRFQMNRSLLLIIGIVFLIIFGAVYFVKSRFITK